MEDFEVRLFDLIETKAFEELNAEDLTFVLEHITENEYKMHREIIGESGQLDYSVPVPLPLPAPEKKAVFFKRTIPLYQALLAAGCVAFLVYIFRPSEQQTIVEYAQIEKPESGSLSSTITIHDTIVKFVEVIRYQEKLMHDTVAIVQSIVVPRETRMLEAGNSLPPLLPKANEKPGSSLSDDKTFALLPKIVNSGIFDLSK